MSYSRFLEYLDMGRVKKVLFAHFSFCIDVHSKPLFMMPYARLFMTIQQARIV